ncbi:MAG TPA: choice-of-anchor D domain-containing protein [Candidatus Limnocylindrales bacterium]|nr:choice-of-anchor D domain-containing protein [Candidatus Limnocylindrales bacterium]
MPAMPLFFEPAVPDTGSEVQFVSRGDGATVALTQDGIEIAAGGGSANTEASVDLRFKERGREASGLVWRGTGKLRGETNYLVGNDRKQWRMHVPHFEHAETSFEGIGISAYGGNSGFEYDVRIRPGTDLSNFRVSLSGARDVRLDTGGDLMMRSGTAEIRMRRPAVYEEAGGAEPAGRERKPRRLSSAYVIERDGTVGFQVAGRNPRATLVIDPSISVAYSSFLGGEGTDVAQSVVADSSGMLYIGGTTTSASTFPETTTAQLGPGSGASGAEFFIAKLDPTKSGANSLVYLTFLGGSASQARGLVAVNSSGQVALTGTTTSADYPVTDGSARTTGSNDTVVSELDSTGSKLLYSTLFGGNGAESTQGMGGIAFAPSGALFIASDTSSTNLPATAGAYDGVYQSSATDGFLAVFQPSSVPALKYCTYFGLSGNVAIGGVAADSSNHAYIAGTFTPDSTAAFPAKNAFQAAFGGGADAFVMKLSPSGGGVADLLYATLLGGGGTDQAFAIAVDSLTPPHAYVTGTTSSTNFPTNGATAAYQTRLPSNANAQTSDAFLTVIAQSGSGATSFAYSTYLGGSQTDAGMGLAVVAPYAVYVAGTANSWDFPWLDNLQPFNGYGDAFIAKLDTTSAGAGSLIYSTPLGGTSPPGVRAGAQGTAIASSVSGSVWVVGQTSSADFPSAGNAGNGFQTICTSCQATPAAADAFVVEVQENASRQLPSLYFSAPGIPLNFGKQSLGSASTPPQFAAIKNSGEAALNISSIGITGPNSADFSLSNASGCAPATINPGAMCSFEVTFIPGVVGPEGAFVEVTSDAPGSPQVLEVVGTTVGLVALPASLNFGNQLEGTTSDTQIVTLTNTSSAPLEIDTVTEGGPNWTSFPPGSGTACHAQQTLAAQAACAVPVEFAPTTTGPLQAEFDIQYHVQGLSEQQLTIPLTGIGQPPAPLASIQPSTLTFGTVSDGATGSTQVVTLTNTGSAALNLTSIRITGTNVADFGILTTGSSPCPASSGSLAINASCTVGVQFAPQSSGAKSAALSFTDNATGSPQSVPLAGTGQSSAIQIAPGSLTFAGQSIGTKSAAQQITITNSGTSALAVNGISVAGSNSGDFAELNNCPPSLGAGANCTVNVTFEPVAAGTRTASIHIADDAPNSPQTVSLTGTALQAGVSVSPVSVSFGNQAAGTASAATAVTVTNSGTGALVITRISTSGTNAADFSETDNCSGSSAPNGIAGGGTCTIQVTFTPSCGVAASARSATLTLADNAPGSPQSVGLTGTATGEVCFAAATGGSMAVTVAAGQVATYSLEIAAANGFSGNVTLACTGAPQAANCTINPSAANIGGGGMTPMSVTVTTTARTVVAGRPSVAPFLHAALQHESQVARDALALLGFVVSFVFLALSRSRWATLLCRFVLAGALFCVLSCFFSACGGGGSGSGPILPSDPGTPSGTYKITVTATTGGTSAGSVALTLTVD